MLRMLKPIYRLCRNLNLRTCVRYLTASQASEALRPFFFAVHPDFFGQHPKERAVNEASLQKLSSYLECLFSANNASPTTVKFYLRDPLQDSKKAVQRANDVSVGFEVVTIKLVSRDVQSTVSQILNTCQLDTDHLKSLVKRFAHQSQAFPRPVKWDPSYYAYTNKQIPKDASSPARCKVVNKTLGSWLVKNRQRALKRLEKSQFIREEAEALRLDLCSSYHLCDVRWESDWNIGAFRMSLSSVRKILLENPTYASYIKGKELIFSSITGVCKEGFIVLSNEAVPQYWSQVLEHLPKTLQLMDGLSSMEEEVSCYLGNIIISREKYFHRITIENYTLLLQKLISSLNSYHSSRRRWKEGRVIPPNSMQQLKLVIEGTIGHVALLRSGRFVLPASTQPQEAISFLLKNKTKSWERLKNYPRLQADRKRLVAQCMKNYSLKSLEVDLSLTEEQANECLNKLIDSQLRLPVSMQDLRLRISRYYSVLRDGEVCIPWNLHI
ncbi:T-cell activation inhibitor, mitochondrial-like [Anneissia japonica]|uniref:T-cell activation inhibitor, mitochondrial-like n=1 Tax=Anneissia japonica TaxID=1529436 RepID=UPI001425B961|nr:T-cell activation inhibitor, mitochondrial-like [Anneissia japonica]